MVREKEKKGKSGTKTGHLSCPWVPNGMVAVLSSTSVSNSQAHHVKQKENVYFGNLGPNLG